MNRVIFIDAVETVFSLAPLKSSFDDLGLPSGTDRLFFAQLLRDAFALSSAGDFHPFPDIARGTLKVLLASLGHDAAEPSIERVLDAFSRLPPHPDVEPALRLLHESACPTVLLTNGSGLNTRKLAEDNGLLPWINDIISVDDFQIWKPRRDLYLAAARRHNCAPEQALLIAAHAWDVNGARCSGLKGIWVQRQDACYHPLMAAPDARAANLEEAATLALELLR